MPTSSRDSCAQPAATAAAVSIWPFTSSTSTTGQPSSAARSAVEPRASAGFGHAIEQAHDALDDGDIGRCGVPRDQIDKRAGAIAQLSRLKLGRPAATAWNAGSI